MALAAWRRGDSTPRAQSVRQLGSQKAHTLLWLEAAAAAYGAQRDHLSAVPRVRGVAGRSQRRRPTAAGELRTARHGFDSLKAHHVRRT